MIPPLHYAVIGAGIAGLSCARALAASGVHVTVFDKSRGPGGRMSTRRGEGWACDHGAQYFTARDPLFQAELARWQAAGVAARWTGLSKASAKTWRGTPSCSATTCAQAVSWPWPCGAVPVTTCTLLVGSTRTVAASQPPAP